MERPLETIDLGLYDFEANGRKLPATVKLKVYFDDAPFDGDIPEDIEAYQRGEFQMYVARVEAWFDGEVSGEDVLGGIAAKDLQDVTSCMEEHGMIEQALSDLASRLERITKAVGC